MSGCLAWTVVGPAEQAPSITLVPSAGRLTLYNLGNPDLQLWGDQLEGFPPDIEKQAQVIPKGGSYYFLTDRLKTLMRSTVGDNGIKMAAFEVYLSDQRARDYIATFDLRVQMTSGIMTIQPRPSGLRLANGFPQAGAGSN